MDSLITLYGNGRKLWFFVRPSSEAREIEDSVMTPDSLMGILQRLGSAIVSCFQEVGDTIYLPNGWLDCVVTLGNVAGCSSLLSIGLKIPGRDLIKCGDSFVGVFQLIREGRKNTLMDLGTWIWNGSK